MIDRTEPATGVVAGVGGNPATLRAVRWAAREADRRHVSLDLVQVLPPSHHDHVLQAPHGRARALLEQGRHVAAASAPDVPVRLSVVSGVAGPALVHVAERAELLVLGSRTAAGDLDLTVGRIVAHAIGHARCPVVLVPQIWDPDAAHSGNVLVHVDGSDEAVGAVAFAAAVADRWKAPLEAVVVGARRSSETEEQTHRQRLTDALAGTTDRHPHLERHETVLWGNAAEAILQESRGRARLIVLCSRGHGALTASLLGATTQTVVRMASCPTAVLPPEVAKAWASREAGRVKEGA
ncbi:universal stress protein [Actinomycetospora cinnamomea]|uniref:Nucleotide-binding universal stress UspA family protein n=1 Tax=Actinomycetospora cinnamomea TaxID=663609 RepID=A0A2U1E9F5_9PSEU|nr:universal stress protein [Actinomycetospora cinnamomea]PVY96349.1 nucleotide-binding universal stress UspA family protein [Actinomycetospora cinnamomea]